MKVIDAVNTLDEHSRVGLDRKLSGCFMNDSRVLRIAIAFGCTLLCMASLICISEPTLAAPDSSRLGARYDSTEANVTFRVYSSRATRIEVDLYASPMGSPDVLHLVLNPD